MENGEKIAWHVDVHRAKLDCSFQNLYIHVLDVYRRQPILNTLSVEIDATVEL